jgi:exodeoxyribonuclease V alpha subunit
MKRYLGSGLIKGIGPVMAERIVRRFDKETLNVIEHAVERLSEVEGVGKKRIQMIRKAWEEQKEIRGLMLFLQSNGIGPGIAAKIFKQYGSRSVEVVRGNPYRLATDIFGIGFLIADRIAENLGFPKDSRFRIEEGVLHVLHRMADEGHLYYPDEPLADKCRDLLQVEKELVYRALADLAQEKRIVIEDPLERLEKSRENHRGIYLPHFHRCESGVASRLKALFTSPRSIRDIDAGPALQWVQRQIHVTLAEKQKEAIRSALLHKVMIITGGPGTGKTMIINAVLKIFSALRIKALLAAPTGRAAKRMAESTGHPARTIHRMLEYSLQKGGFQKDESTPLDCELLIVDEASMIDTVLMYHLMKAVPLNATLIFVGDVNQLPSVGAGNVLKDMIGSGAFPVVELREIFRQARESLIIVNAHRIHNGESPQLKPFGPGDDFCFIEQEEPGEVRRIILELVQRRIPRRFGFHPLDQIQVLTPMHRGESGSEKLNAELQRTLNPGEAAVLRGEREYRVNDKVMQIRNNYEKDVFNGDIGRIVRVDREMQEVMISFDGREVPYDYADLDEILLAYAISVHKSQGSEYPAVVIPLLSEHYLLLQRNLIYTAVTRGRKLVVLVGSKRALRIAVEKR